MSDGSLPQQFLDRFSLLFPSDQFPTVYQTLQTKRPVSFRINTIKAGRKKVLSQLANYGIQPQAVSWYKDAFTTDLIDAKELTDSEPFKNGEIYIQNLSSMIPPLMMDPSPSDFVLDIAAAPGSKTSLISVLMENKGEIVANDKSHERLYKLRSIVQRQGIENVKVIQKAGEVVWKWYPEYFDKVLVDVPCSMEGRITTTDPNSYKDWSVKKIKVLSHLQKKLLRSAVSSTKVGGMIVYSSCTYAPEENEEVINWILEKEKGSVEVEEILLTDIKVQQGLTSWNGKQFDTSLGKTVRVLPDNKMEGFFIAKLRKVASNIPSLL
jgi:NOL1/NOP2/sun family putative RNA methylase